MSEEQQVPAQDGEPGASDARREPKVIKRYTNRKLYDTVESRYVTLDEIAQMIKGGAEVKIIDNRSKEDLTSVTLAQIIFEEEKKRSQMPLGALREIIRHGGESLASFYQEKVQKPVLDRVGEVRSKTDALREDIEQRVRSVIPAMLRRDEKNGPEGAADASLGKDVLAAGQQAAQEVRTKVDAAVKAAVDAATAAAQAQLQELQQKIDVLEKKLEQLRK